VEEARLCTLGVELRGQVAVLTSEKEQNLISWAREKRDRDSIIGAVDLQNASKATEMDAVKAELTRVRSKLEAATTRSSARFTSSGQPSGMQVQPTQGDPAVARLQLGVDETIRGWRTSRAVGARIKGRHQRREQSSRSGHADSKSTLVLPAWISRSGAIHHSGFDGSDAECHQWNSRPPDRGENHSRGGKEVRDPEEGAVAVWGVPVGTIGRRHRGTRWP